MANEARDGESEAIVTFEGMGMIESRKQHQIGEPPPLELCSQSEGAYPFRRDSLCQQSPNGTLPFIKSVSSRHLRIRPAGSQP